MSVRGVQPPTNWKKRFLREGAETVAAFLAEPVQGAGGLMVPQDDYFPRIREICDKYDVLFMADEVITGFGRLGHWFGLEHWNVQPDIISFAKGITSGYLPLGGIGISDRVFKVLADAPPTRRWMHAFTYSGHPTCCAVALATLDIVEKEGLVEEAGRKGKKLLAGLKQLATHENVGDVRGLGLMCGVELVEDKATKKRFSADRKIGVRVYQECCKRGLVSRIKDDIYMLGARIRYFRCRPGSLRQYPWRGHPGRIDVVMRYAVGVFAKPISMASLVRYVQPSIKELA